MQKEKARTIGNTILRIIMYIILISICWIGSWWCDEVYAFHLIMLGTIFSILVSDILKSSLNIFRMVRLVIFSIGLYTILSYVLKPISIPVIYVPLVIAGKSGFFSPVAVKSILTSIVSIIQHEISAKL